MRLVVARIETAGVMTSVVARLGTSVPSVAAALDGWEGATVAAI